MTNIVIFIKSLYEFSGNNENLSNNKKIGQQFASICCDARARRFDSKTGLQLTKNFRRLNDSKREPQFSVIRNAVGFILSFILF